MNLLNMSSRYYYTLLGDVTLIPSKVLDEVVNDVILPKLHQRLLRVFLSCSNSLGKCPLQMACLKSSYNPLVESKRGGVWRIKYNFDIGMKIINKKRMFSSIINNKKNL